MTNKTQIAELRKICEILNDYGYSPDWKGGDVGVHNAAKTIQIIIKKHCESSKMLEAAKARIAELEEVQRHLDLALRKAEGVSEALRRRAEKAEAEKAEAEIAALRGDAVPVYQHRFSRKFAGAEWGEWKECTKPVYDASLDEGNNTATKCEVRILFSTPQRGDAVPVGYLFANDRGQILYSPVNHPIAGFINQGPIFTHAQPVVVLPPAPTGQDCPEHIQDPFSWACGAEWMLMRVKDSLNSADGEGE